MHAYGHEHDEHTEHEHTERSPRTLAVTLTSVVLLLIFFCVAGATDAGLTPRARIARRDVASTVGITIGLIVFFALVGWCWLSCMHPQWDPCACCLGTCTCMKRVSSGALYYASRGRWGEKPVWRDDEDDDDDLEMGRRRRQSMRIADTDSQSETYVAQPAMRVPSPHQAMDRMTAPEDVNPNTNTDPTARLNAHDRAVLEIVGHQRTGSGDAQRQRDRERRHRRARSQDATREPTDVLQPESGAGRRSMDPQLVQPAHARSRSEAVDRWRQNIG